MVQYRFGNTNEVIRIVTIGVSTYLKGHKSSQISGIGTQSSKMGDFIFLQALRTRKGKMIWERKRSFDSRFNKILRS